MSFDRRVKRTAKRTLRALIDGGRKSDVAGQPTHVLGSSQAEAIAALREMPIPPATPGSTDAPYDRDEVHAVEYRRARNAAKLARQARRRR